MGRMARHGRSGKWAEGPGSARDITGYRRIKVDLEGLSYGMDRKLPEDKGYSRI
jgi:hypothetical protein